MESPSLYANLSESFVRSPRRRRITLWLAFRTMFLGSLPIWVSLLANSVCITVTMHFMSRPEATVSTLAGIGIALALNNCVVRTFIVGFNVGMSALVSLASAGSQPAKAAQIFNKTLIAGALTYFVLAGLVVVVQEGILWSRLDAETA